MLDHQPKNGIVSIRSKHSVNDAVSRLRQTLEAKAIKIFAIVDHSGEAEQAGLRMSNTKLLIFGNPKAGTPLMLAAPTIAMDLPLKILVWEDHEGNVLITFNSPEFLRDRHHLPSHLMQVLSVVGGLVDEIAQ